MAKLGQKYYIVLFFNILVTAVLFFYILSHLGLDYKRTRALTTSDFTTQTDDVASAKFYFVSVAPLFFAALVPMAFFIRIVTIKFFDVAGFENMDVKNSNWIMDTFKFLRYFHILVSIVATLFIVVSFILLSIDAVDCNSNNLNKNNLCTNQIFCCATDIRPAAFPGINPRCPYISGCPGITQASTDLPWDPWYTCTFIATLLFLVFMIIHVAIGLFMDFGETNTMMESTTDMTPLSVEKKFKEQKEQTLYRELH